MVIETLTAIEQIEFDRILSAKRSLGEAAYLWCHSSGDVVLWPDRKASQDDAGEHTVYRWTGIPEAVIDALVSSGAADSDA